MKRAHFSRLVICMISLVLTAQSGVASEGDAGKAAPVRPTASSETAAKTQPPTRSVPVYVPPRRGQPRARVGGGVRGSTTKTPTLLALAPDHVAHTARSQPTLLWHLDRVPAEPATLIFRFNITSDEEIDPLIAVVLERPAQPGLQRIDLSSYEFSLETGREYQWSVALVTDSEHPVRDVVTLGWIERVESGETRAEHANTDAAVLAAAGLWYDAVDVADGAERAALLDQIGLASAQLP
jgi:hypothetical protein